MERICELGRECKWAVVAALLVWGVVMAGVGGRLPHAMISFSVTIGGTK
jgi:hypothetical protein